MDPLRFSIAVLPLATYLAVLGLLQLRRRPIVVAGGADLSALALAISGLAVIGPLELFMPEPAAARFGPNVWFLLIGLFWLACSFLNLSSRPRIVVYGLPTDRIGKVLEGTATALGSEVQSLGSCFRVVDLGIDFQVMPIKLSRNVTFVALSREQDLAGWNRLEAALRGAISTLDIRPARGNMLLASVGMALILVAVWQMADDPQAVALAAEQLMRP